MILNGYRDVLSLFLLNTHTDPHTLTKCISLDLYINIFCMHNTEYINPPNFHLHPLKCFLIVVLLPWSLFFPLAALPCPTYPLLAHSQSPLCFPCWWVTYTCFLTRLFPFFPHLTSSNLPSGCCQSVPCFHAPGSILLICLFCLLGSSYRWDHMVFFFHQLAYLTYHNILQFHPCLCKG